MHLGEAALAVSPYFLLLLSCERLSVMAGGATGLKNKIERASARFFCGHLTPRPYFRLVRESRLARALRQVRVLARR